MLFVTSCFIGTVWYRKKTSGVYPAVPRSSFDGTGVKLAHFCLIGTNLTGDLRLVSELTLIQSLIDALHGKECLVGAPFDDPAFVDHDNLISPGNR